MKLDQREPSPVAVEKGVGALLAGLNDRQPSRRWRVALPPDGIERAGAVGTGDLDHARIVGPDDQGPVGNIGTPRPATDKDVADHAAEEVA